MNNLIQNIYNPLEILKNKITNVQQIDKCKELVLNNLYFNAYVAKTNARKTGYKTFYAKFINVNNIYTNSNVNCTLHINSILQDKNLISLKNITKISTLCYAVFSAIIENFENDLCHIDDNTKPAIIAFDDKYKQIKKELNKGIKYFIHKDLGTQLYPSISLQKYKINIVYTDILDNKKIIYRISEHECEKTYKQNTMTNYINLLQWLNNHSDKSYAKIIPMKITVGIKNIDDVVQEELLKEYKIEETGQCVVFNSHFEAIMIYNINKKLSPNVSGYMEEENIDDEYIFSNNVTIEVIEKQLEILSQYEMSYTKDIYPIISGEENINLTD